LPRGAAERAGARRAAEARARHQTPDTRHQTPDTRHQTPDARRQTYEPVAEVLGAEVVCELGALRPREHAAAAG
jgi:hypothetical protein